MRWGGLALLTAVFAVVAPSASAAEIVDEIPVNPAAYGGYTIAPDGTVWAIEQSPGTIHNLDPESGADLETITTVSGFYTTIGFHGNRVYAGDSPNLYSWLTGTDDTSDPGRVTSDQSTQSRIGSNQMILRVTDDGVGAIALGQNNKVGTVNLTDLDQANPFYPQSWFGSGISDPVGTSTAFQSCVYSGEGVIVGTPDPDCGFYIGHGGGDPGRFGYAIDTAFGDGGIYVLEFNDNEVSFVSLSGDGCPCASSDFSLPAGPSGGANLPFSMRRVPGTGNLLISSAGNRRIDEFTTSGDHVRSFGFGVRTGADGFETCESQCLPGLPIQSEPRANFTQLDIVNGLLYAGTPSDQSIQVISLGGDSRLGLSAKPRRVKKGDKTKLTADLASCDPDDQVQFQIKDGQAFDDLGRAKPVDGSCDASRKAKITKKSVFRAVAADSGSTTIATSPKVTVKLK